MARKALVTDSELMERLSDAFRAAGYEGASLALLAESTGLKKASLYHRFPGGKEQMGLEVLRDAGEWLAGNVLAPLAGSGAPRERLVLMTRQLDAFYLGGRKACLLNLLSTPLGQDSPFKAAIRQLFEIFADSLTRVMIEAGVSPESAAVRAERALILIQGGLVLARGLDSPEPFQRVLATLPDELLGEEQ